MTPADALQLMLDQLDSHSLVVQLAPLNPRLRGYNEGGCKRVKVDENPKWYRTFCSRHISTRVRNHRKVDTKIKRANTLRSLRRLVAGKTTGKYGAELEAIAREMARKAA